jgi:hypothetical protein
MKLPQKLNLFYTITQNELYTIELKNQNKTDNICFNYVNFFPLYDAQTKQEVGRVKITGNQINQNTISWNNYEFIFFLTKYNSSLNMNYNFETPIVKPPTPLPEFKTRITSISGNQWRRHGTVRFRPVDYTRYIDIELNCMC